jgi:L-glyceraldehyde 3-phosphate reductase
MLTGKYLNGIPADSRMAAGSSLSSEFLTDEVVERIRALNAIADRRGQTLAQLALTWAMRDRRVTSVLIGASSVTQLEDSLSAVRAQPLTEAELAEIDKHAVESGIDLWRESATS